ncbi:Hypothetical predicted protein [Paramuricea clavata]|uniref:Uncharacterized protein n=1 Tax=Paramuricea clavata TaxID=317549 RepID=A0A6S7JD12_PARCT|nr:Hypothetical predicted protein [Paramuricea clavata]
MNTTTKLLVDGGIYGFNGLLSDLKRFVDETLGLKGNQLSSTIIEIPPSNDEDQHDNLTNATVIVDQLTSLLLAYTKDAPPSKQQGMINAHRNRIHITRLQT